MGCLILVSRTEPADMKPMTEEHLAILRRHMVEVIALQADLMSEEIGKGTLGERVLDAIGRVLLLSVRAQAVPSPRPGGSGMRAG
jgi:hypothetical protein